MKTIELNPQNRNEAKQSSDGKIFDTDHIKGTIYSNGVLLDLTVFPFNGGVFTHMLGNSDRPIVFIDAHHNTVYARMAKGIEGVVTITIEEN